MIGYEGHRGWINYLAVDPAIYVGKSSTQLMEQAEELLRNAAAPKLICRYVLRTKKLPIFISTGSWCGRTPPRIRGRDRFLGSMWLVAALEQSRERHLSKAESQFGLVSCSGGSKQNCGLNHDRLRRSPWLDQLFGG